jgi:hypothetical protein
MLRANGVLGADMARAAGREEPWTGSRVKTPFFPL